MIDAKEAVNGSDDEVLMGELNKINHSIDKEQLIFLTDKDARELREDAIREVVEGRIEDAVAAVEKLANSAKSSLLELVEEVHAEGEQEAEANAITVENGEEAEELLEEGDNVEGSQAAIKRTATAAQVADKTEKIQSTKMSVEENEDVADVDELQSIIEEEKEALAEERAALEETEEQLNEIATQLAESTPEEVEELLDDIDCEELDG